MAKNFTIVTFIISFFLAVYVYFTRQPQTLRENLTPESEHQPRIIMTDLKLYRYLEGVPKTYLAARQGFIFDPNIIELNGEVKGYRDTKDSGYQTMGAETARILLKAESLGSVFKQSEVERIELTSFVDVGVRDHLLTTDYAEYVADKNIVYSPRPVRVEGLGRSFSGADGFVYSLQEESLVMAGLVKGKMLPPEQ